MKANPWKDVSNTLRVVELTLIAGGNKSFGIKKGNTIRSQMVAKHDGNILFLKIVILVYQKEKWICQLVLVMYK